MDDAGGGLRGLRAAPTAELTQALLRRYGIHGRQSKDLGGSSNLNLLVFDGPARYVVRVYRPYVTAGRLAAIHLVRHELDRAGVPCPRLVATREGEPWVSVGGRLVEVELYVDHDAKMDCWGRLQGGLPMLGRIHSLLQPLDVSADGRRPLFANYLEPARARSATAQGKARIRGWRPTPAEERLARLSDELAELVTAAGGGQAETLPTQLVHGDFWDNNVLFQGGRIVLVTDFDFMGERARVDDLALTLYFADSSLGQETTEFGSLGCDAWWTPTRAGLTSPSPRRSGPPCRWRSRASRYGRSEAGSPCWTTRRRPATSLPSCRSTSSAHCKSCAASTNGNRPSSDDRASRRSSARHVWIRCASSPRAHETFWLALSQNSLLFNTPGHQQTPPASGLPGRTGSLPQQLEARVIESVDLILAGGGGSRMTWWSARGQARTAFSSGKCRSAMAPAPAALAARNY